MASITFDFSGLGGLVERYHGDLNDTTPSPHLRYLGGENQFANGIFNPFKKYGYISPANNSFEELTGVVNNIINSIQYDPGSDQVFMSEEGERIIKLDGLDDTSVTEYLEITEGETIKDMLIYEINGKKAIVYAIDSNSKLVESASSPNGNTGGMYLGFKTIDDTEGAVVLDKDVLNTAGTVLEYTLVAPTLYTGSTFYGRKFAQEFDGGDVYGRRITGAAIAMRRAAGTGAGITMKMSICSPASASSSPYTNRGAWSNATTYSINDTVTNGGNTWQCIQAHDSAATANDEPGVGSAYEDYWDYFGAPGTELASATFSLSDVPVLTSGGSERYAVAFNTSVELTTDNYWIVIEEVGANMTASDQLAIVGSVNSTGIYDGYKAKRFRDAATNHWKAFDLNGDNGLDTMDFQLITNRHDRWTANKGTGTRSLVTGQFGIETGKSTFLYLADNGLVYWKTGQNIHAVNGSSTGGFTGTALENVLVFPSYIEVADIAETRSRMYIGVQKSNITSATDPRTFNADKVGIYIWDRKSQIVGSTDFYPCPGAKEIKAVFTSSDGTVKAITVSNTGFTEIRGASGNQYQVLHTLEKDAYPKTRRGISQIGSMSMWIGANGVFYGFGSVVDGADQQLYKLGTITETLSSSAIPSALLVGYENSTPRISVLFGLNFV